MKNEGQAMGLTAFVLEGLEASVAVFFRYFQMQTQIFKENSCQFQNELCELLWNPSGE